MLVRTFPNEMPGIFRVHAHDAAAVAVHGTKFARVGSREISLAVDDRVGVVARACGHKADAEDASVGGIAKAFHGELLAAALSKLAGHANVREWVRRVGRSDLDRHFDEIIAVDRFLRLNEGHVALSAPEGRREDEKDEEHKGGGAEFGFFNHLGSADPRAHRSGLAVQFKFRAYPPVREKPVDDGQYSVQIAQRVEAQHDGGHKLLSLMQEARIVLQSKTLREHLVYWSEGPEA